MEEYNNEQEVVEETTEQEVEKKQGGSGSMIGSIIVIIVIIIGGLYFWGSKNAEEVPVADPLAEGGELLEYMDRDEIPEGVPAQLPVPAEAVTGIIAE